MRLSVGGGGGGVSGGKEAIEPSEGGAAVDIEGDESSLLSLSNERRRDEIELRVRSMVIDSHGCDQPSLLLRT
jgi:hypothetical protein